MGPLWPCRSACWSASCQVSVFLKKGSCPAKLQRGSAAAAAHSSYSMEEPRSQPPVPQSRQPSEAEKYREDGADWERLAPEGRRERRIYSK